MEKAGVKITVAIIIIVLPTVYAALCDETFGDPCLINVSRSLPNMDTSRALSDTCTSNGCDKNDLDPNSWYRIDYNVYHTCPSTGCDNLIWFPDPIGLPEDGIREQRINVKIGGDCQSREYIVFTKNCSHTTVLCLASSLTDCSERLVLDGNLQTSPKLSVESNDESSDSSAKRMLATISLIGLSTVAALFN